MSSHEHPRIAVIDWPEVAAAGYSFTAIKASESTYYLNPYYASDAVQAARVGLFVMPYAFANPFRAKDNGSAHAQADAAARVVGSVAVPAGQMLPLALDIEHDPYAVGQKTNECYGLSRAAMVTWIRQFLAEAQLKTGKKPVIYTLASWWKVCTGNSAAFGGYPLWIASYGKSDPAAGRMAQVHVLAAHGQRCHPRHHGFGHGRGLPRPGLARRPGSQAAGPGAAPGP